MPAVLRVKRASEAGFQDVVIQLAHALDWVVAHFRPVRIQRADGSVYYETPVQADGKGFVDCVFVRDRVVWGELKTATGRLTPEQKLWIAWLQAAGQEVYVWRPDDFDDIKRILER